MSVYWTNIFFWHHYRQHHHQQYHQRSMATVQQNFYWLQLTTCCRQSYEMTPNYVIRLTRINRWWMSGWLLLLSSTDSASSSSPSLSSSEASHSMSSSYGAHNTADLFQWPQTRERDLFSDIGMLSERHIAHRIDSQHRKKGKTTIQTSTQARIY